MSNDHVLKWLDDKENFLYGYNEQILKKDIKKIYMFDLDYTLIKTKSGKKFPIDKEDWVLLYDNIKDKICKISDKSGLIGIISNQKGLKTDIQKNDWIYKINQINLILKIDFVFASISDNVYRKPLIGSYEFVKGQFNNIRWAELSDKKKIYYIGDAAGRETDFSDTDIKFATNCKLKFKTPEFFFSIDKSQKIGSINYPEINYFSESEQSELFEKLEKLIESNKKVLIMTIGLPASGKSFLRKEIIKRFCYFTYLNNDDINKKVLSSKLIEKNSSTSTDISYIIDDNTNINKYDREKKLKKYDTYYKIGIWFNFDMKVCWHLNWLRMYWFGGKLLPNVTYYTLNKKFDKTNLSARFDNFIQIDKVFGEMNLEDKIKYYY